MNNFLWLSRCIRHFAYKIPFITWWQQHCQMDSIFIPIYHLGSEAEAISHHASWKWCSNDLNASLPRSTERLDSSTLCYTHRRAYPLQRCDSPINGFLHVKCHKLGSHATSGATCSLEEDLVLIHGLEAQHEPGGLNEQDKNAFHCRGVCRGEDWSRWFSME